MPEILFNYDMAPATWAYVSALMIIGIYFRFHRFWSVRNFDLLALILFSPGLLLVGHGVMKPVPSVEAFGYVWLLAVGLLFLIRLLIDPVMVRRPLMEPNLSASGLTFTTIALLVFLVGNITTKPITPGDDARPARQLEDIFHRRASNHPEDLSRHGPGYPLFYDLADIPVRALATSDTDPPGQAREVLLAQVSVRIVAIVGHVAVLVGLLLIGYRHFGNAQTGVAAAALYLLLPYTAEMSGRVDHVLPAAFLVWAVEEYRRPILAGMLLGLATGAVFFPLFLLPLWCSFYWRRGIVRFLAGFAGMIALLIATLPLTVSDPATWSTQLQAMLGVTSLVPENAQGFWQFYEQAYRIPLIAVYVGLVLSLAVWPAQKNLGTLLSCSAAVMLGTQFWNASEGELAMAWYLPLLILTIFRPNLEDRLAITAVPEWGLVVARFTRMFQWLRPSGGRQAKPDVSPEPDTTEPRA